MPEKKPKEWVVEAVAKNVRAGICKLDDDFRAKQPKLFAAVSRLIEQENRHTAAVERGTNMIRITGRIKSQTEKGVLFLEVPINGMPENEVGECWWPISQVKVTRGYSGPVDSIEAPAWLVKSKKEEAARKLFVAESGVAV